MIAWRGMVRRDRLRLRLLTRAAEPVDYGLDGADGFFACVGRGLVDLSTPPLNGGSAQRESVESEVNLDHAGIALHSLDWAFDQNISLMQHSHRSGKLAYKLHVMLNDQDQTLALNGLKQFARIVTFATCHT